MKFKDLLFDGTNSGINKIFNNWRCTNLDLAYYKLRSGVVKKIRCWPHRYELISFYLFYFTP